jgi:hypothetical protein
MSKRPHQSKKNENKRPDLTSNLLLYSTPWARKQKRSKPAESGAQNKNSLALAERREMHTITDTCLKGLLTLREQTNPLYEQRQLQHALLKKNSKIPGANNIKHKRVRFKKEKPINKKGNLALLVKTPPNPFAPKENTRRAQRA